MRTYDPALRLPVGPQRASLVISPGRRRLTVPFRLDPVRPGVFEGTVRLDLAGARLPLGGFSGSGTRWSGSPAAAGATRRCCWLPWSSRR
ncbi:hypothetical protein ACFQZ0_15390 [Streptomyces erythrogriseus]